MNRILFIVLVALFLTWIIYIIVEIDKQVIVKDNMELLQKECDSLKIRLDSLEKRKMEINIYIQ